MERFREYTRVEHVILSLLFPVVVDLRDLAHAAESLSFNGYSMPTRPPILPLNVSQNSSPLSIPHSVIPLERCFNSIPHQMIKSK